MIARRFGPGHECCQLQESGAMCGCGESINLAPSWWTDHSLQAQMLQVNRNPFVACQIAHGWMPATLCLWPVLNWAIRSQQIPLRTQAHYRIWSLPRWPNRSESAQLQPPPLSGGIPKPNSAFCPLPINHFGNLQFNFLLATPAAFGLVNPNGILPISLGRHVTNARYRFIHRYRYIYL